MKEMDFPYSPIDSQVLDSVDPPVSMDQLVEFEDKLDESVPNSGITHETSEVASRDFKDFAEGPVDPDEVRLHKAYVTPKVREDTHHQQPPIDPQARHDASEVVIPPKGYRSKRRPSPDMSVDLEIVNSDECDVEEEPRPSARVAFLGVKI
jgi:hypothetical protein